MHVIKILNLRPMVFVWVLLKLHHQIGVAFMILNIQIFLKKIKNKRFFE